MVVDYWIALNKCFRCASEEEIIVNNHLSLFHGWLIDKESLFELLKKAIIPKEDTY